MALLKRKDETKELVNVFEVNGVPSFRQFYDVGIFFWKCIYKGYLAEWHNIESPTISNPAKKRCRNYLSMGKALCSELANLIWSENCSVQVNQKGFDLTKGQKDPLQFYVDSVLKDNNFINKMRGLIEQSLALGGACIRTYADGKSDKQGNLVEIRDKQGNLIKGIDVKLAYYMADQFIPISWDNSKIKEGVFIERKAKNGWYYTKLEFHEKHGDEYVISNRVYKTDRPPVGNTSQNILGIRTPFSEVYGNLSEEVSLKDLHCALFTYFAPNIANNLDDNSPLGISIYANAHDTLKALDIAFDSLSQEILLGKKRIIVPSSAIRSIRDSRGQEHRYFDANDSVYEALSSDSTEQLKIQDNTVTLRIDEHIKAINCLLDILCMQCGLSVGTLSFDKASGLKTATEVISENSKTFRTVKLMQEPLKESIENTITNIIDMARLYDVHFMFEGKEYSVDELARNGWNTSVTFDDSIIQDKTSEVNQGVLLVQNGIMSKKSFMLNILRYTPERAEQEIALLLEEKKLDASARVESIDWNNIEI